MYKTNVVKLSFLYTILIGFMFVGCGDKGDTKADNEVDDKNETIVSDDSNSEPPPNCNYLDQEKINIVLEKCKELYEETSSEMVQNCGKQTITTYCEYANEVNKVCQDYCRDTSLKLWP